MFIKKMASFIPILSVLLLLTACTNGSIDTENGQPKIKEQQDNPYDILVEEKNSELELKPLELTDYGQEVGLQLKNPSYHKFAVNISMTIDGEVKETEELQGDFVWIKISYSGKDITPNNPTEY